MKVNSMKHNLDIVLFSAALLTQINLFGQATHAAREHQAGRPRRLTFQATGRRPSTRMVSSAERAPRSATMPDSRSTKRDACGLSPTTPPV